MGVSGATMTGKASPPDRFEPFADDASVRSIGSLSIENGTDQIALHGSLEAADEPPRTVKNPFA